jgi:hypothetical protein
LADESKSDALKISSREELENWFRSLPPEHGRWVAIAIAARAALRVSPFVVRRASRKSGEDVRRFLNLAFAVFSASSLAWIAARYPKYVDTLPIYDATTTAGVRAAAPEAAAAHYAARAALFSRLTPLSEFPSLFISSAGISIEHAVYAGANVGINASVMWAAASWDVEFIESGGSAQALASLPIWQNGAPDQHRKCWERLQRALPSDGNWEVWIDLYNRRLDGASDSEEIELLFATIPHMERKSGPAVANKWIADRLRELRELPVVPSKLPATIEPIIADGKIALPANPSEADLDSETLGAALTALRAQIADFAGDLDDEANIDRRVISFLRRLGPVIN